MAELTSFSYHPSRSIVHHIDVRVKIASLVAVSLCIVRSGFQALAVLTIVFAVLGIIGRLPVIRMFREVRYFGLFLVFVFAARALSPSGPPYVRIVNFAVSMPAIFDGALVCWRLFMVVISGFIFICTTRSSDIKSAIEWYLRPFPVIPGKRVATMIGLVARFVPVIFQQVRETSDAQRARGIEQRRNPVYRALKLAVPLIRRTFENADKLVFAMEARCYSEDRTEHRFSSAPRDWITLMLVISLCAICLIL